MSIDNTTFYKSAAGFYLSSLPGGGWRVWLNTVPLWFILGPTAMASSWITWRAAVKCESISQFLEAAPYLLLFYIFFALPLLFVVPYLLLVLSKQCTVTFNTAQRTISLPVLPHRKPSNPRQIVGVGYTTIRLDKCAGVRVVPWSNEVNSVDPWDPYNTEVQFFRRELVPSQYRLEMRLKNGDVIPFAYYFPGTLLYWVRLKRLEALAEWFNEALGLASQAHIQDVLPEHSPEEIAWKQPLPLAQWICTILAALLISSTYIFLCIRYEDYMADIPSKLRIFVGFLLAAFGYFTTDHYFRTARAHREAFKTSCADE